MSDLLPLVYVMRKISKLQFYNSMTMTIEARESMGPMIASAELQSFLHRREKTLIDGDAWLHMPLYSDALLYK